MTGLATRTTTALLQGLAGSPDGPEWRALDGRYRPVIISFARQWGLAEHDANDVAQEALAQFALDFAKGRYDRDRGRLSAWLIGIARHRIIDAQRALARRGQLRGQTAMIDLAAPAEITQVWNTSQEAAILDLALSELRQTSRANPATLRAWELTTLHEVPADEAARQTGLSVEDVYLARHRVTKRLRELVENLRAMFDDEA